MIIALAYVYPATNPKIYAPVARRFVETYMEHPPGMQDHDIHVLVNGDANGLDKLFSPLACTFLTHDNSGKDIGAYQKAAEEIPCDLLVCLGAPIHFHKAGWLDRLVNAYEKHGPGMYGPWGFHQPTTHLRTTAFFLPPELLRSYPVRVGNDARYTFEHDKTKSMTAHTLKMGFGCYMVTWRGCYEPKDWDHVSDADTLFMDQHREREKK